MDLLIDPTRVSVFITFTSQVVKVNEGSGLKMSSSVVLSEKTESSVLFNGLSGRFVV